jgi:hypothetical protein
MTERNFKNKHRVAGKKPLNDDGIPQKEHRVLILATGVRFSVGSPKSFRETSSEVFFLTSVHTRRWDF